MDIRVSKSSCRRDIRSSRSSLVEQRTPGWWDQASQVFVRAQDHAACLARDNCRRWKRLGSM